MTDPPAAGSPYSVTQLAAGLVGWLLLCLGAGAWGALVTTPEIEGWYRTLAKPAWTPPDAVFGPVWTTLYVLMGVAAWLVWKVGSVPNETREGPVQRATWLPLGLFVLQLALNVGWSWIFFGQHRLGWAFAELVVLAAVVVVTAVAFYRVNRWAGWLLVPYLLWLAYAGALNFVIFRLNNA